MAHLCLSLFSSTVYGTFYAVKILFPTKSYSNETLFQTSFLLRLSFQPEFCQSLSSLPPSLKKDARGSIK